MICSRAIVAVLILCLGAVANAQQEPIDSGIEERVEVKLVLVDTVVVDRKGRTVSGLTQDDFRLSVKGRAQEIDTFDVDCPAGAVSEPIALKPGAQREELPAPRQPRRVVFALDYYHTPLTERHWAMQQLKAMIAYNKTPAEEIMIVAIADGLRIEQRFTKDPRQALATLERMEHDTSLWAREFGGVSNRSFFEDLGVLMDVLSFIDGAKAVVLISGYYAQASSQDLWFRDVAERSALARAPIYPADIYGLGANTPAGGSGALARLANESGGRTTYMTDDLSLAYARAQQDGSCRYALGFYVNAAEETKGRVRIDVEGSGRSARTYEWFRTVSEQDRRESMLRAAFADPGAFDNPLVRMAVIPLRPISRKQWESVAIIQFPLHVGDDPVELDVVAALARAGLARRKFKGVFEVEGVESGDRRVTLFFRGDLKPATYSLTALLSPRLEREIAFSTSADFTVPEVPDGVFVRGPFMAQAVTDGLLLEATDDGFVPIDPSSRAAKALGDDASFETLVVHRIARKEKLFASWSICTVDKKWKAPAGATIERRLVARDGSKTAYDFDPIVFELPAKGKARCHNGIDSLEMAGVDPNRYELSVSLRDAEGEPIARGLSLLLVE